MKSSLVCLALAALLFLALFALCAPGFLFTRDAPGKADAVVLFVGPGYHARLGEAQQLIKEGYARYLLIPSSGEVFRADGSGGLVRLSGNDRRGTLFFRVRIAANYKKCYENTHIEALEAKRAMDELGLSSALLVSSAYHMRRIRMIAGRVFAAGRYSVSCNPARWQTPFGFADWFNKERLQIMVSEYVKITWFLMYGVVS